MTFRLIMAVIGGASLGYMFRGWIDNRKWKR